MTTPTSPPAPPPPSESSHPPSSDGTSLGPPDGGDRSRAGAVWVTGTGAFLLLAAAAVFVAVRWDTIGPDAKLAILGALTGGFLLAGRGLKTLLPATAGVLYHLGAFLIPVNVAAVGLHFELGWEQHLLLGGAVATGSWFVLNLVERSTVLRWAAVVAATVLAAGIGATSDLPAPLALAAFALAAELLRAHRSAIAWSIVAGLAPALALTEPLLPFGTGVLDTLGLSASAPHGTALVAGATAALVLGRNAHRRADLVLVALAAGAAGLGIASTWVGLRPAGGASVLTACVLFLAIEITAHFVAHDRFWGRPAHIGAVGAEIAAAAATPVVLGFAWWPLVEGSSAPIAWQEVVGGTAGALAWFVADLRRRSRDGSPMDVALLVGAGWAPATLGIASALLAGIAIGTSSTLAVAVAGVAVAAVLVASGRPLAHGVATALVVPAPALAIGAHPGLRWWGAGVAIAGSLVIAAAAVVRARMGDRIDNAPLAWALGIAALGPIAAGLLVLHGNVDELVLALGVAVTCWLVAAVLDLGAPHRDTRALGLVGRVAALGSLAVPLLDGHVDAKPTAIVSALLIAMAAADAARRRAPIDLFSLPVTLPVLVLSAARVAGLSFPEAGVAVCVLAAVAAGVHLLLTERWAAPGVAVVASSATLGLGLALGEVTTGGTAAIVLGGIVLAYSTVHRSVVGAVVGWTAITAGIWAHLGDARVVASDAYVAPVAVALLVAGIRARRAGVSSWAAFAAPILLLGGSALVERVDGGSGWHAIVAGAVGVAAVLAGGQQRLLAPMLLGTALLVGLTGYESLAVTRDIPTWGWLALGGSVLLAAGVAMERHDTGPLETGRRLVDVVGERFT